MPLYKTISVNTQTTVKIWKIEESYDDLIAPLDLKPNSLERVLGMKSELHQRGFLSVRHLFENLDIQTKIYFMMIMESLTLKMESKFL